MSGILFFGAPGPWEMLIILVAVLVVFGGRKIPQLAKDLGSGIREFRKSLSGTTQEIEENMRIDEDDDYEEVRTSRKKKSGARKKS